MLCGTEWPVGCQAPQEKLGLSRVEALAESQVISLAKRNSNLRLYQSREDSWAQMCPGRLWGQVWTVLLHEGTAQGLYPLFCRSELSEHGGWLFSQTSLAFPQGCLWGQSQVTTGS